jgi:hypothetical protein
MTAPFDLKQLKACVPVSAASRQDTSKTSAHSLKQRLQQQYPLRLIK